MGRVSAICVSEHKGERKRPVPVAQLLADHGIHGDAHAGGGHRQLSLLAAADIAAASIQLGELPPGIFAENLIIEGLDFSLLGR